MLKIHYDAMNGYSVPDGMAETFVNDVIITRNPSAGDYELTIGSDTLVTQFRLAVANKQIQPSDLVFVYGNQEIPVNVYGDLRFWPEGLADQPMKTMMKLLKTKRTKE